MFKKIKNNKAADLQINVIVMMLIFVFALFLALDFWTAASTKILVVKEIQAAEVYCLVKTISDNYDLLNASGVDKESLDLSTYQTRAVNLMGRGVKGFDDTSSGELYSRIDNLVNVNQYSTKIKGLLTRPIGEMGIRTELVFTTKTFIQTFPDLFNRNDNETNTAGDQIHVIVSAKIVPAPV